MEARLRKHSMEWLGDSEVATLIRRQDWARTPLGAMARWPACLRTAISICLHCASPVTVYWGDELITLYNDACMAYLREAHPRALGMPAAELFSGNWSTVGPLLTTALAHGIATSSRNQPAPLGRCPGPDEPRFDLTATPIRDEQGKVGGVMVFAFDITEHVRTTQALADEMAELHRLQAQQRVLVAELQHRTRNLLAVVRAIAAHSFAGGTTGDAALASFFERLGSLGRAQGLISRAEGKPVKLSDIVHAELEAYAHGTQARLEVHGPAVRLSTRQVQIVALALHELVTNAVKYGALRTPGGALSVTWETWVGAQDRPRLALLWRESGVTMPPRAGIHRGQGSELIENSLRFSLHADTQLVFGNDGVWCRIELPLDTPAPSSAALPPTAEARP